MEAKPEDCAKAAYQAYYNFLFLKNQAEILLWETLSDEMKLVWFAVARATIEKFEGRSMVDLDSE